MAAEWRCEIVRDAIATHGTPKIINSDQGSQFTFKVYTALLKEKQIQISLEGEGRATRNIFIELLWRTVKYEPIYLHVNDDGLS